MFGACRICLEGGRVRIFGLKECLRKDPLSLGSLDTTSDSVKAVKTRRIPGVFTSMEVPEEGSFGDHDSSDMIPCTRGLGMESFEQCLYTKDRQYVLPQDTRCVENGFNLSLNLSR